MDTLSRPRHHEDLTIRKATPSHASPEGSAGDDEDEADGDAGDKKKEEEREHESSKPVQGAKARAKAIPAGAYLIPGRGKVSEVSQSAKINIKDLRSMCEDFSRDSL
jgi:hypothetical protein